MKLSAHSAGLIVGTILIVIACGLYFTTRQASISYTDPAHRFFVELPNGSTTKAVPATGGSSETLILHSDSETVQITITPWTGSDALTVDDLAAEFPWIAAMNAQQIAAVGKVGIAFHVPPNGDSDVWFASRGYLYQITEFGSRSDLLSAVDAHWHFY